MKFANGNVVVMVQVESLEGLENVEEIVQVDGVGMFTLSLLVLYATCQVRVLIEMFEW